MDDCGLNMKIAVIICSAWGSYTFYLYDCVFFLPYYHSIHSHGHKYQSKIKVYNDSNNKLVNYSYGKCLVGSDYFCLTSYTAYSLLKSIHTGKI